MFGRLRAIYVHINGVVRWLGSRLFSATVETVLLYNPSTWTMTHSLETELDAAHSHLLKAAFNVHWPDRVRNVDLYRVSSTEHQAAQRSPASRGDLIRTKAT